MLRPAKAVAWRKELAVRAGLLESLAEAEARGSIGGLEATIIR